MGIILNLRLFDWTAQEDDSEAIITLRMNFVGGPMFSYQYGYPCYSYDCIYESLQKDYSCHTNLNTMEIKFSGLIEGCLHNEKFYAFETFLSFLNENNLVKEEFCKKRINQ